MWERIAAASRAYSQLPLEPLWETIPTGGETLKLQRLMRAQLPANASAYHSRELGEGLSNGTAIGGRQRPRVKTSARIVNQLPREMSSAIVDRNHDAPCCEGEKKKPREWELLEEEYLMKRKDISSPSHERIPKTAVRAGKNEFGEQADNKD
nr:hypothetical protein Iba_chr04aCG18870 [Ipomoea batatas]